jgi:hypothetical protein
VTTERVHELIEVAIDEAVGPRGSVTVRARLALARTALRADRVDDAVDHLGVALNRARRDCAADLVEDALRAIDNGGPR